ncbi:MAG: hypothetical protein ACYTGN_01855 [Planctomycetota bacterium]|jgi:hypothetical protein
MWKLVALLVCSASLGLTGCAGAAAAAVFSSTDLNVLADDMEGALGAQNDMVVWAFGVARGDVDVSEYDYDPPTADNDWTGTVNVADGALPFGDGDVTITFKTVGDDGPVDPQVEDLGDDAQVSMDVSVDFAGMAKTGRTLEIDGDFAAVTKQNGATDVVSDVTGLFDVDYADYRAVIDARDLEMGMDLDAEELTSMVGDFDARIDIPDFALDADLDLQALGNQIGLDYDVGDLSLDYFVSLASLG